MNVINALTIDDYLKGVLPREVVSSWHPESLKVQAVASRTYLASHLGRHSKQGFDLCSDVHCQVYGGTAKEHDSTNKAVDETSGEIMVYDGKPVGAFFHSNCGGMTEDIYAVWRSQSRPYLKPVKCRFGTKDPRYSWTRDIPATEIIQKLREKTNVQGSRLTSLTVTKKSASGRAELIQVKTNKGTYEVTGNTFRLALHPERIRSTLWTQLSKTNSGYHFEGRGWGHGVGMCQWGAKGQAEEGRGYHQILKFYYPGVSFTQWHR